MARLEKVSVACRSRTAPPLRITCNSRCTGPARRRIPRTSLGLEADGRLACSLLNVRHRCGPPARTENPGGDHASSRRDRSGVLDGGWGVRRVPRGRRRQGRIAGRPDHRHLHHQGIRRKHVRRGLAVPGPLLRGRIQLVQLVPPFAQDRQLQLHAARYVPNRAVLSGVRHDSRQMHHDLRSGFAGLRTDGTDRALECEQRLEYVHQGPEGVLGPSGDRLADVLAPYKYQRLLHRGGEQRARQRFGRRQLVRAEPRRSL